MISYLQKYRKNKRYLRHRKFLNKVCDFGSDFGTSPFNTDVKQALLQFKVKVLPEPRKCIEVGSSCNLSGSMFVNEKGAVKIGDFVFMNGVNMRVDHHLQVGNHCMFGPGVKLWDTNNHPLSVSARHEQAEFIAREGFVDSYAAGGGSIIIEDDVWVGMDVTILGPVTIGRGSVIAAGSIVTKDIPPMSLVAGIPARKIGDIPE